MDAMEHCLFILNERMQRGEPGVRDDLAELLNAYVNSTHNADGSRLHDPEGPVAKLSEKWNGTITPDDARDLVEQTRALYYRAHRRLGIGTPAEQAHRQRVRDALWDALAAMSDSESVLQEALHPSGWREARRS